MYVCDCRHVESIRHFPQYTQGLYVPYSGKGVQPATVGLAITPFENKGNIKVLCHPHKVFRSPHGNILILYGTGAGE